MLKYQFYLYLILFSLFLYSCSSDNPAGNNEDPVNSEYTKVLTAESGNVKFELWSSTSGTMRLGYNRIGFKVFESGQPKSSGFVKLSPFLYHSVPTPMQSCPVSAQFSYSDVSQLFAGYAVFTDVSGPDNRWYAGFNYNNQLSADSVLIPVNQYSNAQILNFTDNQSGAAFKITLLKPYTPIQGLNTFQCMLHKTNDNISFEQINNAQIFIMPWMEAMGHGSTNNVHPQANSEGIYEGTVNFNMPGAWSVYDTVYYQNRKVTPNIPPKFTFEP